MISETVRFFKQQGKEVLFDAEHFFDGYKDNPNYALASLQAATDGGADCLCLCDTNGGADPNFIGENHQACSGAIFCEDRHPLS